MSKIFKFNDLDKTPLIVDAIYEGGTIGNSSDDPLHLIIPGIGNQGGFRTSINKKGGYNLVILYSTLSDLDWPDHIDIYNGQFTYYGDNKTPGSQPEDKPGNRILAKCFDALHKNERTNIPPFFIFFKSNKGRDVVFKGLAVPGISNSRSNEDLVGVWRESGGQRFLNYRSVFTILNIPYINKEWLKDLINGNPFSKNCPKVWKDWVEKGVYNALLAEKTIEHRTKFQQLPKNQADLDLIIEIYKHYPKKESYKFEKCAAELLKLMDTGFISYELTRPVRDGGRDAIGKYKIGLEGNSLLIDYALEAKCYNPEGSGAGVIETSRLISRLRHREFGVFITTSYVDQQAYKEIKEDKHPIIIISAADLVNILRRAGIRDKKNLRLWLDTVDSRGI